MKKSFLTVWGLAVLLLSSTANAGPKNITLVSAEQVSELEVMHQQATSLLLENNFQGALRAYSDILLAEPDDETAYTGLGQIYLILGQFQKAHEAFQNALHINAENEVALAGIQKIMDPDGVEGMTNRAEAEGWTEKPKTAKIFTRKNFRLGLLNAQRIQMCLRNAGVYSGPVNGMVGFRTKRAIQNFQKVRGFKETGLVDGITLRALLPYLAYKSR